MKHKIIRLNTLFVVTTIALLMGFGVISNHFLKASPGTIKVLYPNGGETLKAGSNVDIKWRSGGLTANAKMVIVLYKNGIKHSIITKQTANSGNFSWNVPARLPVGKDYRIRIRSLKDLAVNDFSDRNFSVKR